MIKNAEAKAYEQFGLESKQKIIELIKDENITMITSYRNALNNVSQYHRMSEIDYDKSSTQVILHEIISPTFTDDPDIVQAIILAHELGHYFVYKDKSEFKISLLSAEFKLTNYINETLAWRKAKQLLMTWGIIDINGDVNQQKAHADFMQVKNHCLQSYGHPFKHYSRNISRVAITAFRCLVTAYLLIALLFLLKANDIPMPLSHEFQDLDKAYFYDYVRGLFLITVTPWLILRLVIRMLRITKKA